MGIKNWGGPPLDNPWLDVEFKVENKSLGTVDDDTGIVFPPKTSTYFFLDPKKLKDQY